MDPMLQALYILRSGVATAIRGLIVSAFYLESGLWFKATAVFLRGHAYHNYRQYSGCKVVCRRI